MEEKTKATSSDEIRSSVTSIYSDILGKRQAEREARSFKRQQERELHEQEKEAKKRHEDGTKKTKAERREEELEAWKEIIVGLTGDDLEYTSSKGKKKKYRKWITDDDTPVLTPKPKKAKKKNYNKVFEPELNMLKTIVADQNRFTIDLQRRFQNAAGPATKDAAPLNKTLVELAAAVNASRNNSLGMLREIGNLKKTIADLYMKQKKMDDESSGNSGFNSTDVGLMGSNIANQLFGDVPSSAGVAGNAPMPQAPDSGNPYAEGPIIATATLTNPTPAASPVGIQEFDPSTWSGGPTLSPNNAVNFETIPHTVVVEWHKSENRARFKAIRNDTGEELVGCPVPTSDPSKLTFNEKDLTVKGEFDENYKLEIVG